MVDGTAEEVEVVHSNRTRGKILLDKHLLTLYHQDAPNSGRRSLQSWRPAAFILTLQADNDAVTVGSLVMDTANVDTKEKTSRTSNTSTSIHNEGGYLPRKPLIRSISTTQGGLWHQQQPHSAFRITSIKDTTVPRRNNPSSSSSNSIRTLPTCMQQQPPLPISPPHANKHCLTN